VVVLDGEILFPGGYRLGLAGQRAWDGHRTIIESVTAKKRLLRRKRVVYSDSEILFVGGLRRPKRVLARSVAQISPVRQWIEIQPRFHPRRKGAGQRGGRQGLIRTAQRRSHRSPGRQNTLMGKRIGNNPKRGTAQAIPQSFIAAKEEGLVLLNRSTHRESELVPFKRRFRLAEFIVFPLGCV